VANKDTMDSIPSSSSSTLGPPWASDKADNSENATDEKVLRLSRLAYADGDDQDNYGDYSTRMEELFSDQTDEEKSPVDYATHTRFNSLDISAASYRDQLRDVLGVEHSEEDGSDEDEELEVEQSLIHGDELSIDALQLDRSGVPETVSERPRVSLASTHSHAFNAPPFASQQIHVQSALSDTPSSAPSSTFSPNLASSLLPGTPTMKFAKSYLHPAISRLRSSPSQGSSLRSSATPAQSISNELSPPESSHFSALSRDNPSALDLHKDHEEDSEPEREVFHWTHLGGVSNLLFAQRTLKVSSILGSPDLGSPTVLAANGLICIGTYTGLITVFDFKQTLKCVCGADVAGNIHYLEPIYSRCLSFTCR
jgi:vacuolar protein sorting-associated protein 8